MRLTGKSPFIFAALKRAFWRDYCPLWKYPTPVLDVEALRFPSPTFVIPLLRPSRIGTFFIVMRWNMGGDADGERSNAGARMEKYHPARQSVLLIGGTL
jgi:hypothetical protein